MARGSKFSFRRVHNGSFSFFRGIQARENRAIENFGKEKASVIAKSMFSKAFSSYFLH